MPNPMRHADSGNPQISDQAQRRIEVRQAMQEAINAGNQDAFSRAFEDMCQLAAADVRAEYEQRCNGLQQTIDSLTDSMTSGVSGTSASSTAANGVTDAAQAKRLSQEAEDELEKLSEVSDAQVVIAGHTAAVALEFDSQYQGGVDERLRKMVKQRIDGLVKGVKDVSVTDDNTLYERLETLGDRLDGSAALSEIETELKDIIAGIEA